MSLKRKIIFIRHLATKYNKNGVNMGRVLDPGILRDDDAILNFRKKIAQIEGDLSIKSPKEVEIFTSPLRRCVETAEIVAEELSLGWPIQVLPLLNETDMGEFDGKRGTELRSEYGKELIERWMYKPQEFRFPAGESYLEVRERVSLLLRETFSSPERSKYIIACSHVDIIKMAICEVMGISFNSRRFFVIPNGSISVIGIGFDNDLQVEGVNQYPLFS